ncbi:hypothetical protein Glove_179g3 [Diversispora epigaea]|uniref:Uncharacterized protein n=1 Tax=Diversispora epigaea TaxID=1348612 RepID=A0A397IUG6_9GLOM|nr:hypothetical protein Glove_179g3 [Diversispora epigaea]
MLIFKISISIAEIILNPNNENIKIFEKIIKPVLLKNLVKKVLKKLAAFKKSAVPKRLAAPKSNKRIIEIETLQKEKTKIKSIRKDKKNDGNDDETDKGNEAYEANEAYETDEGDEYYNEIINIDKSKEE